MSYRWWHLPGRAVLAARALGKSLWRDWFPRRCCRTCYWSRDRSGPTLDCTLGLGEGYGRPVWPDGVCDDWEKRRSKPTTGN